MRKSFHIGLTGAARAFTVVAPFVPGLLLAAVASSACSSDPPAAVTGTVARVEIRQTGLLLTRAGDARTLSAVAFDASGKEVEARFGWTSSRPEGISVDGAGKVTAVTANGSTQIVAEADGVRSAPLLVVATTPAPGAILLADSQIVGEPTETVPGATPDFANTYDVVLRDVAAPPVGAVILDTESKIVGGRVLAVAPAPAGSGGQHAVRVGLLSSRELFPELTLSEVLDLSQATVVVSPQLESTYEMRRDGTQLTFLPRTAKSALQTRAGTRALPPFLSCEATVTGLGEGAPLPIALSAPPLFSVKINPTLDVQFTKEKGLERLVLGAEPTVSVEGGITVTTAFEGKVACNVELFTIRIPVGGPLALVVGGLVPVGVGLEASGKLTLATFGASTKLEAKTKASLGLACPDRGGCEMVKSLGDFTVTATPTIDSPSLGDLRVDVGLGAFGTIDMAVGNPFLKSLRFDAVKLKAGGKVSGSFASQVSQITDAAYKSDYKVSLEGGAGVGADLSGAAKLLGLGGVSALELVISKDLATSPAAATVRPVSVEVTRAGSSTETDPTKFQAGDTVTTTVKLDAATVAFFGLYNVKDVIVARKSLGEVKEVARVTATDGQSEFSVSFVASDRGSTTELTAFLTTRILPLDLLSLEVGSGVVTTPQLQIVAGSTHACAVFPNGRLKCWGGNSGGQLGVGDETERTSPTAVAAITTARSVALGDDHTCAALTDGTVRCWGRNDVGQLGDGSTTSSNVPVPVPGITNATAVSAGERFSCALLADGTAKCWGGSPSDSSGVLGNGTNTGSLTPVAVSGLANAVALASGRSHSCALLGDGTVKCWGLNASGELGVPSSGPGKCDGSSCAQTAIPVPGLTNVTKLVTGSAFTCALVGTAARCWGSNSFGELGNGGGSDSSTPVDVTGIPVATALSAGRNHACAALPDGTVRCWGSASVGLGDTLATTSSPTPVVVGGIATARSVASGDSFSCALLTTDTAACWGVGGAGQLGNGGKANATAPVAVLGFP